jgi:hypothetical protein
MRAIPSNHLLLLATACFAVALLVAGAFLGICL